MSTNVKVTARECRNNTEKMIRRFNKKVKKAKIMEELRDRRYYKKPSDAKREKRRRAKRAREKELRKQLAAMRREKTDKRN